MSKTYRDFLVEGVISLIESRDNIFTGAVNVAMSNEFKDIDQVFENGDHYVFDIQQFEDTNDINLQKLVDLIKAIATTIDSIININNISTEELEIGVE